MLASTVALVFCFSPHLSAQQASPIKLDKKVDLNIVAHQDDDIVFMNPDILNAVVQGHRQVTIYNGRKPRSG